MEIRLTNGQASVNTDQLIDADAVLLEKATEFKELCHKLNKAYFLVLDVNPLNIKDGCFCSAYFYKEDDSDEEKNKRLNKIGSFIYNALKSVFGTRPL